MVCIIKIFGYLGLIFFPCHRCSDRQILYENGNARFRIRSPPILRINYPLRWSVMREMRRDMRYSSWNVCMPRAYHWPSGMGVCSFRIWYSRMSASILLFRHFIRIIWTGYRTPPCFVLRRITIEILQHRNSISSETRGINCCVFCALKKFSKISKEISR